MPNDLTLSDEIITRQIEALKRWDENNQIFSGLLRIKVPTLVAGGLSDALDNPENIRIIANAIPFSWVAYFPNAGMTVN